MNDIQTKNFLFMIQMKADSDKRKKIAEIESKYNEYLNKVIKINTEFVHSCHNIIKVYEALKENNLQALGAKNQFKTNQLHSNLGIGERKHTVSVMGSGDWGYSSVWIDNNNKKLQFEVSNNHELKYSGDLHQFLIDHKEDFISNEKFKNLIHKCMERVNVFIEQFNTFNNDYTNYVSKLVG